MADASLADALTLFTKVNVSMLKRIEQLEGKKTNKYVKEKEISKPESVVDETQPTEIESFSKKALGDLQKVFQYKAIQEKRDPDKRQKLKEMADEDLFMTIFKGAAFLGAIVALFEKLWKNLGIGNTIDALKGAASGLTVATNKLIDGVIEGLSKFEKGLAQSIEKRMAQLNIKPPVTPTPPKPRSALETAAVGLEKGGVKGLITDADQVAKSRRRLFGLIGPKVEEEPKPISGGADHWADRHVVMEPQKPKSKFSQFIEKAEAGFDRLKLGALEKLQPLIQGINKVLKTDAVTFLRNIIKIPGVVDAIFAYKDLRDTTTEYEQKKISKEQMYQRFSEVGPAAIGSAFGGVLGMGLGATGAGILGSAVPGAGTAAGLFTGGLIGTVGGSMAGDFLGRYLSRALLSEENQQEVGQFLGEMFLGAGLPGGMDRLKEAELNRAKEQQATKIQDGIITKDGKIVVPHADDSLYAMKSGGPFEKFFAKNNKLLEKNADLIEKLSDTNDTHLSRHSELLKETNKLLVEMMDKLQQPTINKANVINNNFNDGMTLRSLQAMI